MGWVRFLLLGDLGQQLDLAGQAAELERLKRSLRATNPWDKMEAEVNRLQAENGELKLYIAVLFRLLVTKGVATVEEIHTLLRAIDESDGQPDKAFRGDVVTGAPSPPPAAASSDGNPFAGLGE